MRLNCSYYRSRAEGGERSTVHSFDGVRFSLLGVYRWVPPSWAELEINAFVFLRQFCEQFCVFHGFSEGIQDGSKKG